MKLNDHIRELIAIGAAVGANCHSCLRYHAAKAREQGASDDEIVEAIEVGRAVRKGAHDRMDKLANELMSGRRTTASLGAADCGCGSGGAIVPVIRVREGLHRGKKERRLSRMPLADVKLREGEFA
jgi:AhpD family alkylhydroperoxidase